MSHYLTGERMERDQHLFHGDASVLKGIPVVVYKMVVIVRVDHEIVIHGKNIAGTHIGFWQMDISWPQ